MSYSLNVSAASKAEAKEKIGHDFAYDRGEQGWFCARCNGFPPHDFYDGFFQP